MIALFSLGHIVATPGALAALARANQSPAFFLARHARGDWGELDSSDIAENEYGMANGFRLLSSYWRSEAAWDTHEVRGELAGDI